MKNRTLHINWKRTQIGYVDMPKHTESFRNIKSVESARKIVQSRHRDRIESAVYQNDDSKQYILT